jgi:enoyl-CoA hydratase
MTDPADPAQGELTRALDEDRVLVLAIDRPARRNALHTALLQRIAAELEAADGDDGVGCVVISGSDTLFAAGADVEEIAEAGPRAALEDPRVAAWQAIRGARKPLIAAVEGYCLGGGLELALHADIVIAGEGASFGLPEVKLGIMPGAGGTQLLPRTVGRSLAMKLALSGEFVGADEALRAGLAAEVVGAGEACGRARELGKRIARNAPYAVQLAKRSVNAAFSLPVEEGLRYERSLFSVLQGTEDKAEGIAAFREKRKPKFTGR